MPSDIRSFFGGKPAASQEKAAPPSKQPSEPKKSRGKRKILDDSDEEDGTPPKKATPQKPPQKKREPTPEGEATNTSDYFAKAKPKKSAPVRTSNSAAKPAVETPKNSPAKPKATPRSTRSQGSNTATPNGRASTRRKAPVNYNENDENIKIIGDEVDGGDDDVFADAIKQNGRHGRDDYEESDEQDDEQPLKPKSRSRAAAKHSKAKTEDDDDFAPVEENDPIAVEDEQEFEDPPKPANPASKPANKRKSVELGDEDEATPQKKKAAKKSASNKSPAKKNGKLEEVQDSAEVKAIMDEIPLVRPPTPPAEKKPFNWANHNNSAAPAAQGSKEIPTGAENCLAGLVFVFTGLLESLSRDDGQNLVKRYGGKVTGTPSSKTSFVVLGSDAGPKKLETIAKNNIKTINEDGLFELIRRLPANGGDSKAANAFEQKQNIEMEKIKQAAEAEAKEEENKQKKAAAKSPAKPTANKTGPKASASATSSNAAPDNRLWTVKYAPTQLGQICGNKQQVDRLQRWLKAFPKNHRTGFKMPGPDGSGTFRAAMIYGPPGIGKTTAAHLVAKLEGYDIVESNASDTRSKKLVENGLKGVLDTTSLLGYFSADGEQVEKSKKKLVLIMDEVDGMSAGDRGGVGALAAVCKKTEIPMILICNDRKLPKMKPFDFVTYSLQFRKPTVDQIRSRIMTIGFREKLDLSANVVNALIEGSGADIRQVVNMISTAKMDQELTEQKLDFDGSKKMSKAWQKHVILKPWDIVSKILGGGLFHSSSKTTLNEKIELYFNDHEWSSLMLQENYLGTNPILANQYHGKEQNLKYLELVDKAANSISEGDLVDRMIHGTQQQWSLMPTHAVFSFVRPASFVSGSLAGHSTSFTSWLGQNSTQGKLSRMVKEIQGHMRLRASGDRHETRQQYIPVLWTQLIQRLAKQGKEAVPEVIELMDSYYLTKDDWDAIGELGVGPMCIDAEKNPKAVKIESATKATFTRLYNLQSHPLPYMKASNVVAPKKAAKEKPDLEEAIDESDEGEVLDEYPKEEAEDDDLGDPTKDKYVKQPKKKKAAATGKGKKAANNDDGEESEADTKPKKGKGKGAKGKGKA